MTMNFDVPIATMISFKFFLTLVVRFKIGAKQQDILKTKLYGKPGNPLFLELLDGHRQKK